MVKTITVDEDRCLACKACVLQCALAHTSVGSLVKAVENEAPLEPRVHVEAVGEFGTPTQCRHCNDAPCAAICPVSAIARCREDGPVLLDKERCIGCGLCLLACPFGVIDLSGNGKKAVKCDLCIERTAMGKQPACVDACPTRAIKYQEMERWPDPSNAQAGPEPVQDGAGGPDTVCCCVCGQEMGTRKRLQLVRKKLAGRVEVANICSRCRRIRGAQRRDKESSLATGAGRKNKE